MQRRYKRNGGEYKTRVNVSLSVDTHERLKQYAWESHKTVSQVITDWTWAAKVKKTEIPGQVKLDDLAPKKAKRRGAGGVSR